MMNDNTTWEPPPGRHSVRIGATMLHHLGLGPEPDEDYFAFKYTFRPQSFDRNTPSTLTSVDSAANKFTFVQSSAATPESMVWNATQQTKKWQCILLYDEETSEWTLERLDTQFMLSHNKSKNIPKPGTPTGAALTPPPVPISSTIPPLASNSVPVSSANGSRTQTPVPPIPVLAPAAAPIAGPISGRKPPRSSLPALPASLPAKPPPPISSVPTPIASTSKPTPAATQPIKPLPARPRVPKPAPTPQDSIISLGPSQLPKPPRISSPLILPTATASSSSSTPTASSFSLPTSGLPKTVHVVADDDGSEEEESEEEAPTAPAPVQSTSLASHPAFLHDSGEEDSDDEEDILGLGNHNNDAGEEEEDDEEDILGLGPGNNNDDEEDEGDGEDGDDDEEDFDFLADELRQEQPPTPRSQSQYSSQSRPSQPAAMPSLSQRPGLAFPPYGATQQQRAAPPPPLPLALPRQVGGGPISLRRLAGGSEDSGSESE